MSEVFDPYYLWLGIPPADQPPDHYRLLGVTQFESDADVIRNAAEQRMSYLRTVTGPRAKRAQQLVNEIVAAQRILAEDASREKYNAMITESPLAKRRGVAPPAVSTPAFEPPAIDTLDAGSHRRRGGRGGGGRTKSKSNSLQIKIMAAAVPAVLGLIVLIVLLSTGGGKNKANNISNPETAGRSSQSDAGKGVPKSTEAEKKKADRDLEKQLARLEKQRPKPPKPTEPKPDKPEAPKPSKKIAASQGESLPKDRERGAGFNGARASELSETEKAEALLASRGLDEGFNSEWELAELTAAYEEANSAAPGEGDASFEAELNRRIQAKKREILDRWAWLNTNPSDNGGPNDQEYNRTAGWLLQTNQGLDVKNNAKPIASIRKQLDAEYGNQSSTTNEAAILIARKLRDRYAVLQADAGVQAALKTVDGTLAEPPELPQRPSSKEETARKVKKTPKNSDSLNTRELVEWETTEPKFSTHTISKNASTAHGVFAADVDSDGDTDVLSATYHGGKIAWYENDGSQNFVPHVISTDAHASHCVHASDIDGDGDTDILSASYVMFNGNGIAWYENDGRENFTAHVVSKSNAAFRCVFAIDVDSDGDTDILGASVNDHRITLYENDGQQIFTAQTISSNAKGAHSVFAKDLDGDGDIDILSASADDHKITWYENRGNHNFRAKNISTNAAGANCVFVHDVDGDGDLDVISSSFGDNKIAWYENDGKQHFFAHTISTDHINARSVFACDIDKDGDTDVISASSDDAKVAWHRNDGQENFRTHIISKETDAVSMHVADVDNDGDPDVLTASYGTGKIKWHENQLTATSPKRLDGNKFKYPTVGIEELKVRFTTVEKETKLALGTFNMSAKEYLKQEKDLVKRIKIGEGIIAKRSKFQESLPDGEQKTKFGLETEAKYIKPLNGLKAKLQNLPKPDATAIEKNLKEAKQLLEQIRGLPEYAANPESVDRLAALIAKYRRGHEVQQTKMAK